MNANIVDDLRFTLAKRFTPVTAGDLQGAKIGVGIADHETPKKRERNFRVPGVAA